MNFDGFVELEQLNIGYVQYLWQSNRVLKEACYMYNLGAPVPSLHFRLKLKWMVNLIINPNLKPLKSCGERDISGINVIEMHVSTHP